MNVDSAYTCSILHHFWSIYANYYMVPGRDKLYPEQEDLERLARENGYDCFEAWLELGKKGMQLLQDLKLGFSKDEAPGEDIFEDVHEDAAGIHASEIDHDVIAFWQFTTDYARQLDQFHQRSFAAREYGSIAQYYRRAQIGYLKITAKVGSPTIKDADLRILPPPTFALARAGCKTPI